MANLSLIYMHDTGVQFVMIVKNSTGVVDLTSVQSLRLYFQRPDKSIFDRSCSTVDAKKGVIKYITEHRDFDQSGKWSIQLVIRFANNNIRHSNINTITVAKNLS